MSNTQTVDQQVVSIALDWWETGAEWFLHYMCRTLTPHQRGYIGSKISQAVRKHCVADLASRLQCSLSEAEDKLVAAGDPFNAGDVASSTTVTRLLADQHTQASASGDVDCVWDVEEPEGMNDAFDDRVYDFGVEYNRWTCG